MPQLADAGIRRRCARGRDDVSPAAKCATEFAPADAWHKHWCSEECCKLDGGTAPATALQRKREDSDGMTARAMGDRQRKLVSSMRVDSHCAATHATFTFHLALHARVCRWKTPRTSG